MKIKLTKRRDATEKGPMSIMIEHDGSKKFFSCDTNQILEVEDEIGFLILGDKRFQGLFTQVTGSAQAPQGKSMPKNYANKALETEATKTA